MEYVFFGSFFIFIGLLSVITFLGGMFNTEKIRAVAGEKKIKYSATVDGQHYYNGYSAHEAMKRDRKRKANSGSRKKQRYRESKVITVGFTYGSGEYVFHTDPKMTRCLVSQMWVSKGREYTIRMSRGSSGKVRVGFFEVLKGVLVYSDGAVNKVICFLGVIINALMSLTVMGGSFALGVWLIMRGV